ncbi:MAG: tRNA-dihydrouridine synthase, partial [Clostridiales bacterium]|nr:tRNA-dihydrouridine synthase [Clostridiales bacterium]
RDLPRASSIIRETVLAAEPYGVPVTVKFRKGWDEEHGNAVEFACMCRDSGASMITLHARTRDQMYRGKADWTIIEETTRALRGSGVKVMGNGDVKDGESAKRMFDETGVDGISVGRAALGNPWVFSEISDYLEGKGKKTSPSPSERKAVIFEHLDGLIEQLGEERGVKEMRTQLAFYLKGQYGAADFRAVAVRAKEASEVREIVAKWAESARQNQ